jgi:hypothetical protein
VAWPRAHDGGVIAHAQHCAAGAMGEVTAYQVEFREFHDCVTSDK